MATSVTIKFHIDGLRETIRAFKELPVDASKELREESSKLATVLARAAEAEGKADTRQSAIVANTIKVGRDRFPVISVGGVKRIGHRRTPAYKILFGSMFGSNRYQQFGRPHRGKAAYWFFPVIEQHSAEIGAAWSRAADNIVRKFSEGG